MTLSRELRWAASGAAIAALSAIASIFLPAEIGGFNPWDDPHGVGHNVAAVLTRLVIFVIVGGLVGYLCPRRARPGPR